MNKVFSFRFFRFLTACSLFVFSGTAQSAFELEPLMRMNYLKLLEQAADFHKTLLNGDSQAIQTEIAETQEIISRLNRQISLVPQFHHRIHSHRLFRSIEEQLAVIYFNSSLDEKQKKRNVKKLFNSFFELAQVYGLTRDMKDKMFYCAKDKSLWFQESGLANNPINPAYKNCGQEMVL